MDQLPHYVFKLQHKVTAVRSNGFCFLNAVGMVQYMDYDEMVTLDTMESRILFHLAFSVNYYKLFHARHALKDAQRYFKFGAYCENVLDIIVVTTARALNLNLTIYQKRPKGNIQILEHTTDATTKEAHLKFTCDPSNVANNHYEAILILDKPTESHTEEEVNIESPHSSTFEQARSLDDADDVIDLTDDSDMTISQQSESLQNNTSNNELQFPIHLFVKTAAEWVDELPCDIDGLKLYKIKMFITRMGSEKPGSEVLQNAHIEKDLIGTRNVGSCIGNLYCASDDCPFKHSAEGKSNNTKISECG